MPQENAGHPRDHGEARARSCSEFCAVPSGHGTALAFGTDTRILESSTETGGAYTVTASTLPARSVVPAHCHDTETQSVVVLAGRLGAWVAGEHAVLGPGGYFRRPPGLAHSLFNPTDAPASFLEITAPGDRFEEYQRQLSRRTAEGDDPAQFLTDLAAEHGIMFVDDPMTDLRERYHLQ